MDMSSLTIGILIGAVGVFATGFLRKAGEDLYALIKNKVNPGSPESHAPQVVVNLQGNALRNYEELLPVTIDHTSSITYLEIEKSIDSAPPLQRKSVASNYIGLKIEWITYLRSANKCDDGKVSLRLSIDEDYRGRGVWCTVNENEYRELSILPEGARIRVSGEISEASPADVKLSNVHLQIMQRTKA
ncbi:MAG: hypothetical protein Q8M09_14545 [Pseudomonadota bacterium]|nr:hypothetical protein [Pseudomonadota bacterium]MDP1905445.1 hypothetical protein [Pseudomonadota bacterium]